MSGRHSGVKRKLVPCVAEWFKAPESDARAGVESPVRAPVRAATLCPYAQWRASFSGRNRAEAREREREWAEGTVSNCPAYRAHQTLG